MEFGKMLLCKIKNCEDKYFCKKKMEANEKNELFNHSIPFPLISIIFQSRY